MDSAFCWTHLLWDEISPGEGWAPTARDGRPEAAAQALRLAVRWARPPPPALPRRRSSEPAEGRGGDACLRRALTTLTSRDAGARPRGAVGKGALPIGSRFFVYEDGHVRKDSVGSE